MRALECSGSDVDGDTKLGNRLLHVAASNNKSGAACELLDSGAAIIILEAALLSQLDFHLNRPCVLCLCVVAARFVVIACQYGGIGFFLSPDSVIGLRLFLAPCLF